VVVGRSGPLSIRTGKTRTVTVGVTAAGRRALRRAPTTPWVAARFVWRGKGGSTIGQGAYLAP
jgi:hypothetical protein